MGWRVMAREAKSRGGLLGRCGGSGRGEARRLQRAVRAHLRWLGRGAEASHEVGERQRTRPGAVVACRGKARRRTGRLSLVFFSFWKLVSLPSKRPIVLALSITAQIHDLPQFRQ